ncbi:MAG: signal peptidase II [Myxococcota bacterium]|jgi:signal peptidase II|nr:signal peptidase II [Myxococcota bacterium]
MTLKYRLFGLTFLIGVVLDQWTKRTIVEHFYYGERLEVVPGLFDLTHVRNPGGAFSLFADGPFEWRMFFFVGATILAIILLTVFLVQHEGQDYLIPVSLGLVMAGAVGNMIDRLAYGEVIDFIDVHLWSGYIWPTFNIADSAIVLGVGLLLFDVFVAERQHAKSDEPLPGSG